MNAKEHFEQQYNPTPQAWENKPFAATVKFEFGLFSERAGILVIFKPGEIVEGCVFGRTEWADKTKWVVRFDKSTLPFQISAPDFFKLFKA